MTKINVYTVPTSHTGDDTLYESRAVRMCTKLQTTNTATKMLGTAFLIYYMRTMKPSCQYIDAFNSRTEDSGTSTRKMSDHKVVQYPTYPYTHTRLCNEKCLGIRYHPGFSRR